MLRRLSANGRRPAAVPRRPGEFNGSPTSRQPRGYRIATSRRVLRRKVSQFQALFVERPSAASWREIGQVVESGLRLAVDAYGLRDGTNGGVGMVAHDE